MTTKFEKFLGGISEAEWLDKVSGMAASMHEVDRDAAQIWFRFYPLALFKYLQTVDDVAAALRGFALEGDYQLVKRIDKSHDFLFGHQYWPAVKKEIESRAATFDAETGDLEVEARQIAQTVANEVKADVTLTLGITLVGMMTLVQSGIEAFKASAGTVTPVYGSKSARDVVADRSKDDSQGIFGFLKSIDKKYSVSWRDAKADGRFEIISDEDIATASAKDRSRDWKAADDRCWEGVVPVECRSSACGTCWVGVLGGKEKLSDVSPREAKQMKVFGYNQPDEAKPFLRLACQSRISGNATIVIPPWNGVFGRKVYGVEDVELEPATTSAKKLRETIASAMTE